MTFVVTSLQAAEPGYLKHEPGITVCLDEESDEMGLTRVNVYSADREKLIQYIEREWSAEVDYQWFISYVISRIQEVEWVPGPNDGDFALDYPRTILIHLNVQLPSDDPRTFNEVVRAIKGAIEVGSDDPSLVGLEIEIPLAEEV